MSSPSVFNEMIKTAQRLLDRLGQDMVTFVQRTHKVLDSAGLRSAGREFMDSLAIRQYAEAVRRGLRADLDRSIEQQRHDLGLPEHEFVSGNDDSTFGRRGMWCAAWVLDGTDQCGWPEHRHYPRPE